MENNDLGLDDSFMEEMLGDFLDESQGYLTNLNDNLLVLDELVSALEDDAVPQVDTELLNEMFRDAHSLKGLSAMLQLDDINSLTHKVENVFDAARDQSLSITRDVVDLMLQAFDRLAGMVEKLSDPNAEEVESQSVVDGIQQLLENANVSREQGTNVEMDQMLAALQDDAKETTSPSDAELEAALAEAFQKPNTVPQSSLADEPDPLADIVDETEIPDKYLSIFIDETEESLDGMAEALTAEEATEIDSLLIVCHRIKGSAASIGLLRPTKLAHLMEDLLQELRETGRSLTSDISEALLYAFDSLRAYVDTLKTGVHGPDSFSQAHQMLRSVQLSDSTAKTSSTDVQSAATSEPSSTLTSQELRQIADAAPLDVRALAGLVRFEAELPLAELKAQLVCERLEESGDLFYCHPSEQQLEEMQGIDRLVFGIATEHAIEDMQRRIDLEGIEKTVIEVISTTIHESIEECPVADVARKQADAAQSPKEPAPPQEKPTPSAPPANTKPASSPVPKKPQAAAAKGKPTETLRVDIDRLDHLMNLAGQLVINKARFGQIGYQLKEVSSRKQSAQCLENISATFQKILGEADERDGSPPADLSFVHGIQSQVQQMQRDLGIVQNDIANLYKARTLMNDFSEAVHQLDRVSDGIQKSVMDIRMVHIGPLFGRFKRVIRDITRGNGKDIQLVIRGDKTELDKRMIDELGDPLIHMIRNCADHGIESPEDRLAAGKPKQGIVTLDAFHRGNRVSILVRDDGKGLDAEKLRAKAIEKKIISAKDAERLSQQQSLQLIWEAGFSTAEKVTEVSGRGMGMDIVRSKIEQLNGTIDLESQLGVGTTITINLPLTMAILPSLLTVIEDDVFAIPVESVSEIVSIDNKDMTTVHGMKTACVRGRAVSVVDLNELFQWNKRPSKKQTVANEHTLVIIGSEDDEMGLAVDDLLGEEDIVIKSLAENYQNVNGIAGASILGDGRVSLILDVAALVDIACRKGSASGVAKGTASPVLSS